MTISGANVAQPKINLQIRIFNYEGRLETISSVSGSYWLHQKFWKQRNRIYRGFFGAIYWLVMSFTLLSI